MKEICTSSQRKWGYAMTDYKSKMYEFHALVNDILYDAERGKVSWEEAIEQVQIEAKHLLEEDEDE